MTAYTLPGPSGIMEWISPSFLGKELSFPQDKTKWRLTKVLGEKDIRPDGESPEATAVFDCIQTEGPQLGRQAVIRIRMQ